MRVSNPISANDLEGFFTFTYGPSDSPAAAGVITRTVDRTANTVESDAFHILRAGQHELVITYTCGSSTYAVPDEPGTCTQTSVADVLPCEQEAEDTMVLRTTVAVTPATVSAADCVSRIHPR